MKKLGKLRIILIAVSLLILVGCIGLTGYLLFSNYQNVSLFKQAQSNFQRGDDHSLQVAESQLLQLIRNDEDNEAAYIMLGAIAEKRKVYPEQVYYCYMAHKLNPLSAENKAQYIKGLCFAREFVRLENFLSHQHGLTEDLEQILLYAAGQNGNLKKYEAKLNRPGTGNSAAGLALLLFKHRNQKIQEKLNALDQFQTNDPFLRQEILSAKAELYLEAGDIENSEKSLIAAYELNPFAFAPSLGRFYANFRSFGKALQVFEKYLKTYHDQAVAMQTAEIYCLLNQPDKIAELRKQYQSDSGNSAMLCCYYFDALAALSKNDLSALKELTVPLRGLIDTPLAAFMFFAVDVQSGSLTAVQQSYTNLLSHRTYLDLQQRADRMVAELLRRSFGTSSGKMNQLLPLAKSLYSRMPDPFTAKLILLAQRQERSIDTAVLRDALKRFGKDQGILKIGIEYYLNHDLSEAFTLIMAYRKLFPERQNDMLRYEIVHALKSKNFNQASALFMKNFSPELCPEYWNFARATMREKDLQFLSRNQIYAPYCQALLLLKKGQKDAACDLLEKTPPSRNLDLLFFAAMTLGENGRNAGALKLYSLFPEKSLYRLSVLLNMAELFAENGNTGKAVEYAKAAYELAPELPETQLCYADKLHRNGQNSIIPDVIKLTSDSPYSRRLKELWITGMEHRIANSDMNRQRERTRELCRRLLTIDPDNKTAQDCLKKLNKMPQ